jgi:biotin carboxyl carrier protein
MVEVRCELDVSVVNQYEVDEGTRVSAGEVCMMLEVMKMQSYVESPTHGIIHFVAPLGTTVYADDILFTIEEEQHG